MKNRILFKSIYKDAVIMIIRCFIATVLFSVCVKNGWIFNNQSIDISYNTFWKLYSCSFVFVPIILFYKGFTGKYNS